MTGPTACINLNMCKHKRFYRAGQETNVKVSYFTSPSNDVVEISELNWGLRSL